MIDLDELRSTVLVALGDHLGTYTFSNGQTVAALRVDDGSAPYPEQPAVSGLEAVIRPRLEVPVILMLGGYQQQFGSEIVLKQWDDALTTLPAMQALLPYLNAMDSVNIRQIVRVTRSSLLDNIETLTIPISQAFWVANTFDDD